MYKDWTAERWETPFSDVRSLVMVSLTDDGSLSVILEDARGEQRNRWRVVFQSVAAYRNILEEYRLSLASRMDEVDWPKGWSWVLTQSDWLGKFREDEPLVDVHLEGVKHYVIWTEDDVVEVLTPEDPTIDDEGPTGNAPQGGKSTVLYAGEDDLRIRAVTEALGAANPSVLERVMRLLGLRDP